MRIRKCRMHHRTQRSSLIGTRRRVAEKLPVCRSGMRRRNMPSIDGMTKDFGRELRDREFQEGDEIRLPPPGRHRRPVPVLPTPAELQTVRSRSGSSAEADAQASARSERGAQCGGGHSTARVMHWCRCRHRPNRERFGTQDFVDPLLPGDPEAHAAGKRWSRMTVKRMNRPCRKQRVRPVRWVGAIGAGFARRMMPIGGRFAIEYSSGATEPHPVARGPTGARSCPCRSRAGFVDCRESRIGFRLPILRPSFLKLSPTRYPERCRTSATRRRSLQKRPQLGSYKQKVVTAIEKSWHQFRLSNMDDVTAGNLRLRFRVDSRGEVHNLRILRNEANVGLTEFTLEAILAAKIPAMPKGGR